MKRRTMHKCWLASSNMLQKSRKTEKAYKQSKDVWESRGGQVVSSGKSKPAPLTTSEEE